MAKKWFLIENGSVKFERGPYIITAGEVVRMVNGEYVFSPESGCLPSWVLDEIANALDDLNGQKSG